MIDNRKDMSCDEFSACMVDLIATGQDIFAHPHVRRCRLHRALLDDLDTIAKAARQLLGEVDPPDTLWDGIQARLGFELEPPPIFTEVGPGYRVTLAIHVIEPHSPGASPPRLDKPKRQKNRPTIIDATRRFVRREGGDDR